MRKPIHLQNAAEKGSSLIEFLLVTVLFVLPLMMGTFTFGMSLVRANQVTQVCRDAAHMYAYGVDFSQTGGKNLLVQLSDGLNMQTSGGNGVVIFSTVTYIASGDCTAAGKAANSSSCPNLNTYVFVKRIVVGNSSLRASAFGTPNSSIVGSDGSIDVSDYLTDTTDRANGFGNVIAISSGQYAYLAEAFFVAPDFNIWRSGGPQNTGIAARSIF